MDLYLAGGISGNCKPLWSDLAKAERTGKLDIYLAGLNGRRWCVDLYLAGVQGKAKSFATEETPLIDLSILESFYYADEWTEWAIPRLKNFMLDSGAFTFMTSHKGKVDWNDYLKRYAAFINKNDVKLFYELDIDSIVGYETVLQMRKMARSRNRKEAYSRLA